MCNPAIAAAAVIASSAISAMGQMQAGRAQKNMAEYNARTAEESAKYQAARQADRTRRLMAASRVAVSKSGVTMSGSPLDVIADSAVQAELDRQSILRQGVAKAELDRYGGRVAAHSGRLGAATSLLSGAGRAAGILGGGGQ